MAWCMYQLVIAALVGFVWIPVHCQTYFGGIEYVFAIPMTYNRGSNHPPRVLITTTSSIPVQASLTIPGLSFEVNTTVSATVHGDISLPYASLLTNAGKHSKTIIVRSSDDVTIHCFDNEYNNGDGFIVLPISQLGTEHYVVTYVPYSISYQAFFTVSLLGYETSVNFITSIGQDYNVILQPYESYRFNGGNYEDITGTHILSDRPVSVISGIWTNVPVGVSYADGLLVNVPPVKKWGFKYVLAPYMTKTCGYIYRVLSANQTTTVNISTIGTIKLQAEEFYESDVTGDTMTTITSDFPVLVVQFMKGNSACNSRGDPSMIVVSPIESYYNNVTFPVFETTHTATKYYFINVITNCNYVDDLLFDDTTPMQGWNRLTTEDQSICVVRGQITTGLHTVVHPDTMAKFTVSVYMMCECGASYSYQAAIASVVQPQPTKKPPPTDLSLISDIIGLNLYCRGTNMTAIFNSSVVPFTLASDVHMMDQNCAGAPYGDDQAIISTDYQKCQTAMEESEDHIIFRNALIVSSHDNDSPIKPPQVEIECRIERRHMIDTSFISSLKKHVSFGNFSFKLDIFHDETYRARYNSDDYPVDVKFGDNLYLSASVTTVNDLELFVDSCWGTSSADPWHHTSYSIIHDGCPVDESFTLFESGNISIQHFIFKAFAFKGDSWLVFLHCQLAVCDSSKPNSRCSHGCVPDINKKRKRRSAEDLPTITSGPLIVRG